jgi:hypothetical protein
MSEFIMKLDANSDLNKNNYDDSDNESVVSNDNRNSKNVFVSRKRTHQELMYDASRNGII